MSRLHNTTGLRTTPEHSDKLDKRGISRASQTGQPTQQRSVIVAPGRLGHAWTDRQTFLSRRVRSGFTLVELLVVILLIAILAAVLFPVFGQAREQARSAACLSRIKQIGLGLQMYVQDYDEWLPLAVFDDRSGDAHSVSWVREPGANQELLPDLLFPYVGNGQAFVCPTLRFPADRLTSGKFSSSGSYAYMCGHALRPDILGKNPSFLRKFLHLYGPHGLMKHGKGDDIGRPDDFFICGHSIATIPDLSGTVAVFCESFGAHFGVASPDWKKSFLPPELQGEGRPGGTIFVYVDGHAKFKEGLFADMIRELGITQPKLMASLRKPKKPLSPRKARVSIMLPEN